MRWWRCTLCTRPTCLVGILIVLAYWNNCWHVDMSLHSDTLSWFRANQLLQPNAMYICLSTLTHYPGSEPISSYNPMPCIYVSPLWHIILVQSQSALTTQCHALSWEAANTNVIVFRLTRLGLEFHDLRTPGKHVNHYTTDAVE